jgi:hypothetical protein
MALGWWAWPSSGATRLEPAPGGPLVRLIDVPRAGDELVRVDPGTLAPVSRPLRSFNPPFSHAFSPDRRWLALGGGGFRAAGRVQLVDARTWRSRGRIAVGGMGPTSVFWPRARRLVVLVGGAGPGQRVAIVDTVERRVVESHAWRGFSLVSKPTGNGVAVLAAPARRAGAARLLHFDVGGGARAVKLDRIRAGGPAGHDPRRVARFRSPGLAVDGAGNAYVVAADSLLMARVELATGEVAYRELSRTRSALAAVRDWLEPPAMAKGPSEAWWRDAAWLGDGTIAVTGHHEPVTPRGRQRPAPLEPFGAGLIDVERATITTLHPQPFQQYVAGNRLLAHGTTWEAGWRRPSSSGLLAFDSGGEQVFHRFGGKGVTVLGAHRRRAYVWVRPARTLHVLDLRDGRTTHTIPVPPHRMPTFLSPQG